MIHNDPGIFQRVRQCKAYNKVADCYFEHLYNKIN